MKTAIYIRTSTIEQFPEKQLEECKQLALTRGYEIEGIYKEQISAFKQVERPEYDKIKEKARKGEINSVIVWALDRWVRNRDTLLDDVTILRNYGCKIHSIKESWLEAINIEGALGRTIHEFLLGLVGSLAEMESQRKSERTKMAFKAHQGKKWGRPDISKVDEQIIALRQQGMDLRGIAKEVYYWDKNRQKKYISIGYVHKIIKKYSPQKIS